MTVRSISRPLQAILIGFFSILALPASALAAGGAEAAERFDFTAHWAGITMVVAFLVAYLAVIAEEFTDMRKSKPVIITAGLIWVLIGWLYSGTPFNELPAEAARHYLTEFGELFLFLLVAMTYVNAMSERNVFEALRAWLVGRGLGYRQMFWVTGIMSFMLSPVIDNLTTALVMGAVVVAVGKGNAKFILLGCINVVVAANAGGAFSPFGDITTLMVWQKGIVPFETFLLLFVPSVVNYLLPAVIMHFAVPQEETSADVEAVSMRRGARRIFSLFILTIAMTVSLHTFFHLPPFLGMMTGLGFLKVFGFYLRKTHIPTSSDDPNYGQVGDVLPFDSYRQMARAEWDTLFFFFGIIMCVGGLSFVGYLEMTSLYMYGDLGATTANILVGVLSAIVDNIPVMVAVLEMHPTMDMGQWLLVTLTAGTGGSMLSIGSAAGVALMGQARGSYTFFGHLKWTPVIALGYVAGIYAHFLVNGDMFIG